MSGAAAESGPIYRLGDRMLAILEEVGQFFMLAAAAPISMLHRGLPFREVLVQFESIAARSTTIVVITALFTGMVLALQTVVSLGRFGAKPYTGSFVGLSFVLELGPVLTALVVSGRTRQHRGV